MLTMVNPLMIEGQIVYQDDGNEVDALLSSTRGRPSRVPPVRRFYVLPQVPTLAKDTNGKPIFSLIVYRRDEERIDPASTAADVGGGILTFTVELGIDDLVFKRIKNKLAAMVFGDDTDEEVDLSYVPFLEGKVSVAVAGETGTDTGGEREFVKTAVGTGKVSGIGQNRKAVMVKLTQDGASLMSQISNLNTLPINVQYELPFEHRLLGVAMRVWCDMSSSYSLIQETLHTSDEYSDGYLGLSSNHVPIDKVTSVTETLVRSKTAGVEVVPQTSLVDNETLIALEKAGFDMLNKAMDQALQASPPPETMDRTYIEEFIATYSNSFNFSLDRRMVLTRNHYPSANISSVFREAAFDELVTFVDLRTAFFNFLKIPIRVNADFEKLPLDSVTVTVTYQRQRVGGGGREERVDSFNFKDGANIQTFLAYANSLADVTYDWEATVHYKGSQQNYTMKRARVKDDFLVVDVGLLGMIAVDLGLGLVDLAKFPQARVSLRYQSGALGRLLEQDFLLNKEVQSARWTEVIHEEPTEGYEYKVDWIKADGDILPGTWAKSTTSKLRCDAPIPDSLEVSVVCTGNFKDAGPDQIAQVATRLRYEDPGNSYTQEGQVVFTADGQNLPWKIDLRNAQKRDYTYNYTIIYKDGVVKNVPEDGSWLKGEPGFITVGEKYTLEVDVYPTLLTFPDHAKLVQVDLLYDDGPDVRETGSFIFTKEAPGPRTWRVRGKANGTKKYSYTVKYFSAAGDVKESEVIPSETEAIVVPPLAAATPPPTAAPPPTPAPTPAPPTPAPPTPAPTAAPPVTPPVPPTPPGS
jgi:hypothetical protein